MDSQSRTSCQIETTSFNLDVISLKWSWYDHQIVHGMNELSNVSYRDTFDQLSLNKLYTLASAQKK